MKLKIENISIDIPVEVSDVKKASDMQTKSAETRKMIAQVLAEEMLNRRMCKIRYSKADNSKVIYARGEVSVIVEEDEAHAR